MDYKEEKKIRGQCRWSNIQQCQKMEANKTRQMILVNKYLRTFPKTEGLVYPD